ATASVPISAPASALHFDGIDDRVEFGVASALNPPVSGTFTIETWFRWTGGGVGASTGSGGHPNAIPLVRRGLPENDTPSSVNMAYSLGIDNDPADADVLVADFEDSATGLNHPVTGTIVVTPNVWHHAAVTYDGTTWRLYLDGVLDVAQTEGSFTPEDQSIQEAALGTAMDSSGAVEGFFQGDMDEARVWSVVRTSTQIRAGRDHAAPSSTTGLVARWTLDDGSGATGGDGV